MTKPADHVPGRGIPYCSEMDCPNDADFDIYDGPTSDDNTHSCAAHLVEMLDPEKRSEIVAFPAYRERMAAASTAQVPP